ANRSVTTADDQGWESQKLFVSPELHVSGRWVSTDSTFGIHTRTSYASSTVGTKEERALESLVALNYHVLSTHTYTSDLSVGYRYLSVHLASGDDQTGTESTFDNVYSGPEFSFAIRF
ncbi:MAG: hypothetical protein HY815_16085, partial [Candidatus Riflebacteria bacterium]|nr:hypothetical protein [Candidatus Riflebacteria bacterium]